MEKNNLSAAGCLTAGTLYRPAVFVPGNPNATVRSHFYSCRVWFLNPIYLGKRERDRQTRIINHIKSWQMLYVTTMLLLLSSQGHPVPSLRSVFGGGEKTTFAGFPPAKASMCHMPHFKDHFPNHNQSLCLSDLSIPSHCETFFRSQPQDWFNLNNKNVEERPAFQRGHSSQKEI